MAIRTSLSDARFGRVPPEVIVSTASVTSGFGGRTKVAVPENSDWNFRGAGATVDFVPPGNMLDFALNENVIQGSTLSNPNSVGPTTTRSFIIADQNSNITGTTCDAIIASSSANLTTGSSFCDIVGSQNVAINGTATATASYCGVANASNSAITSNSGLVSVCNITASDSAVITKNNTAGSSVSYCGILGTGACSIITDPASTAAVLRSIMSGASTSTLTCTGAGGLDNTVILASDGTTFTNSGSNYMNSNSSLSSRNCPISNSSTGTTERNAVIASINTPITNSVGTATQNASIASANSSFTNTSSNNVSQSLIAGSNACTFANSGTGILQLLAIIGSSAVGYSSSAGSIQGFGSVAHLNSTVANTGSGAIFSTVGVASNNCNFSNTSSGSIAQSGSFGSVNTTFTSSTTSALNQGLAIGSSNGTISATGASAMNSGVLLGCNAGSVINSGQAVLTGAGPVVNGLSNVFCHSATATANNQAIFGTRLDVTGVGNNLTVASGYASAGSGFLNGYRTSGTTTGLLSTDGLVNLTAAATNVTVPLATAMGASFPTNTVRKFLIKNDGGNANCNVVLSGADTYRKKTGWSTHPLQQFRETFALLLVNDATTPFWEPEIPISYSTTALMTTANNFGLTPPKSDASQLPTSTSAANHATLTTTSFVTFNSVTTTNSAMATISGQGIAVNFTGLFDFELTFDMLTSAGGGNNLVRADICTTAGTQVPNSYGEWGGLNTIPGTCTPSVKVTGFFVGTAGTVYTVRLSQDSGNLINASASITTVRLLLSGQF